MSAGDDPRADLIAAARTVRRLIERERAGGAGELVGASLARAARRSPKTTVVVETVAFAVESAGVPAPALESAGAPAFALESAGAPESALESAGAPAPALDTPASADSLFDALTSEARTGSHPATPVHPRDPAARAAIEAAARPLLDQVAAEVRDCQKCALGQTRTQAVPGVGSALSGIAFVGEGPGADEDRLGEPFVGRAGQLLDKIIEAMNAARLIPGVPLNRKTVFIGNVIHCRPPENRVPLPVEVEQSSPYLLRQLAAIKPRVICCLGKTAAEALLGEKSSLGAMRGRLYRFMGAKLIVTYHPAACLRNPAYKRPVWEDMQRLAREYLED